MENAVRAEIKKISDTITRKEREIVEHRDYLEFLSAQLGKPEKK